jgi:hypothetical protein
MQIWTKIQSAYKPFVVVAYDLQYSQNFYNCYLPSTTLIYPLQSLNLIPISMLLIFSGNYFPTATFLHIK